MALKNWFSFTSAKKKYAQYKMTQIKTPKKLIQFIRSKIIKKFLEEQKIINNIKKRKTAKKKKCDRIVCRDAKQQHQRVHTKIIIII